MEDQTHHIKMVNLLYKYELANNWLLHLPIMPEFLQVKIADYLAWKTKIKHRRFRGMFAEASTTFYQEKY